MTSNLQAEIITIGDEILIGQILDSNAVYIAQQLNGIGIEVFRMTSVHDSPQDIVNAINRAKEEVKFIFLTGGLGPTQDDVTKSTLCNYYGDILIENKAVLNHIERLLTSQGVMVIESNRAQALIPSKAEIIFNKVGTAPGMWFERDDYTLVSLPGVPQELHHLFEEAIIPKIQRLYKCPFIIHKTVYTYGIAESSLAEMIVDWERSLPANFKLAYLPGGGNVRLRLSAKGSDKIQLENIAGFYITELYKIIGKYIRSIDEGIDIIQTISKEMTSNALTLSLAESCTGGRLSKMITDREGVSKFYKGGIIAYHTDIKADLLNVDKLLIDKYSVVSSTVAEEMALGVKKIFNTDYGLSITGNAGPTKGDSNAPIGTVFIGVATPKRVFSRGFNFGDLREKVIQKAVNMSLDVLLETTRKGI